MAQDDDVYEAILPGDDPKNPGWRIHLRCDDGYGLVQLSEERVFPEKVLDPNARAIHEIAAIDFAHDEVRWLHARLGELLARWDAVAT